MLEAGAVCVMCKHKQAIHEHHQLPWLAIPRLVDGNRLRVREERPDGIEVGLVRDVHADDQRRGDGHPGSKMGAGFVEANGDIVIRSFANTRSLSGQSLSTKRITRTLLSHCLCFKLTTHPHKVANFHHCKHTRSLKRQLHLASND